VPVPELEPGTEPGTGTQPEPEPEPETQDDTHDPAIRGLAAPASAAALLEEIDSAVLGRAVKGVVSAALAALAAVRRPGACRAGEHTF
jgi:hypothetical protein